MTLIRAVYKEADRQLIQYMKSGLSLACVGLILSISLLLPWITYAQAQITSNSSNNLPGSAVSVSSNSSNNLPGSAVSVSSTVSIQVSNITIKTDEATLKSAITGFLNSGPSIFKTSESYQLNASTQISNEIDGTKHTVQGMEATNAIVGVELSKGLRNLVSSVPQNQTNTITVGTSSACKPSAPNIISCANEVVIK
jgi:hypothetical protein